MVFNTVRSFPDGHRNCYTLKPLNGKDNNYLVRAQFMYGNYDGKNRPPTFDVYIGVNFWLTVKLHSANKTLRLEINHKPTTDFIYICLVNTRLGTPFISALYLRPLSKSAYNSNLGSLTPVGRYNTGSMSPPSSTSSYTPYKDDIYDRLWSPVHPPEISNWDFFSTNIDLSSLSNDAYKVPPSILKGGAKPKSGSYSLAFRRKIDNKATVYIYWHFVETKKLGDDDSREFNIFTSGNKQLGPITLKYLQALTVVSPAITLGSGDLKIWFSINQTNTSTLPPILNAVEVYYAKKLPQFPTYQDDVNAIIDVKTKYGPIKGWQGDPCLPTCPWNELKCSYNGFDPPRIISLNLASRGITGEILPSLSNLTSLNYLNLSYNSLTGEIPESLAKMPNLRVLDLKRNNLSGSVPVALTDKVKSGSLSLSLEGNPNLCTSDACAPKSKKHEIVVILVAAAASLLFVLVIIAVSLYFTRRRREREGYPPPPLSALDQHQSEPLINHQNPPNLGSNDNNELIHGSPVITSCCCWGGFSFLLNIPINVYNSGNNVNKSGTQTSGDVRVGSRNEPASLSSPRNEPKAEL